jgi:hypothetical protein
MLKHIVAIIAFTILVILFTPYAQSALNAFMSAYDWISDLLTQVFSGGKAGNLIRQFIALLCLPLLVALVPAIIYWFARRKAFPYFMAFFWVTWLAEVTAVILLYKVVV